MAALGAKGRTLRQLGKIPEVWTAKNMPTGKLFFASRLWVQRGIPLLESFMNQSEATFGVRPWIVDFTKAPDFLADRINGWVEEKTLAKVKNFISEEAIDTNTRMLLSSALYFKGEWKKSFDSSKIRSEAFIVKAGEKNQAKFMKMSGPLNTYSGQSFQMIEIPYLDGDMVMDVFLPNTLEDLGTVEQALNSEHLDRWMTHLSPREVSVSLPQFEFEFSAELSELLKSMGLGDPFSEGVADFSGMTGTKDLYLGRFHHKTMISMMDLGTTAGSVSGMAQAKRSPAALPMQFVANHPFLFGVRHKPSNSFILLGKVVKPLISAED